MPKPKKKISLLVTLDDKLLWELRQIHQRSALTFDSFVNCVFKVGLEHFDAISQASMAALEEEERAYERTFQADDSESDVGVSLHEIFEEDDHGSA